MGDTQTVTLFNANDSVTGRDGGPYLDVVQAQADEVNRARVEKREPNLDNPPPNAGIQLNNAAQQLATADVNNLPSQAAPNGPEFGWLNDAHKDQDKALSAVVELEFHEEEVPEDETPEPAGPETTLVGEAKGDAELPNPQADAPKVKKSANAGARKSANAGARKRAAAAAARKSAAKKATSRTETRTAVNKVK